MKLIRGCNNIRNRHDGCVLTIGNFDGVHRGHQALLAQLRAEKEKYQLPIVVMLFEPQPLEFFQPSVAPKRLMNLRNKLCYLEKAGVDYVICEKFNKNLANLDPKEFIQTKLIDKLAVRLLLIGEDFRFGAKRQGDIHLLQQAAKQKGFALSVASPLMDNGLRISSTLIREYLSQGNLPLVRELLGHEITLCGRVVHGRALGRTIGFPTANIAFGHHCPPLSGVYAVQIKCLDQSLYNGVANIGVRPTFGGNQQYLLEVNIFDFNKNIYGTHIEVIIKSKIRDEQKFASLDALTQQIANDVDVAKQFFTHK